MRGFYKHSLKCFRCLEKLLNEIMCASHGQQFDLDVFSIAKLKWLIEMIPNRQSSDEIGEFGIFLKLISMPASWKSVEIRVKLYIKETNTMIIPSFQVYNENDSFGSSKSLTFNEVMLHIIFVIISFLYERFLDEYISMFFCGRLLVKFANGKKKNH